MTTGAGHVCVVTSAGGARCVGYNSAGQLGNDGTAASATLVDVVGLRAAATAAGGDIHTCALLVDGTVQCWGADVDGQLGDGEPRTGRPRAGDVAGLAGVVAITAGRRHTCALAGSGAVSCWGANDDGQLGDGTSVARPAPTPVPALTDATLVRSNASAMGTCAISASRGALCWGRNDYCQLGVGVVRDVEGLP